MKDKSDVFVFTQARLNSQRLPRKMLLPFGSPGGSLWDIACEKLGSLNLPTRQKWVSVYESGLEDVAENYDLSIYWRSYESANCDNDVRTIWEICSRVNFKYYVMFNPCLPMLKASTIQLFLDAFLASDAPSMFGVTPVRDYFWNEQGELFYPQGVKILNTKDTPLLYKASHAIYAGLVEDIRNGVQLGDFSFNNPALFEMTDKVELLDVDDKEDFLIAEAVYAATH